MKLNKNYATFPTKVKYLGKPVDYPENIVEAIAYMEENKEECAFCSAPATIAINECQEAWYFTCENCKSKYY